MGRRLEAEFPAGLPKAESTGAKVREQPLQGLQMGTLRPEGKDCRGTEPAAGQGWGPQVPMHQPAGS